MKLHVVTTQKTAIHILIPSKNLKNSLCSALCFLKFVCDAVNDSLLGTQIILFSPQFHSRVSCYNTNRRPELPSMAPRLVTDDWELLVEIPVVP